MGNGYLDFVSQYAKKHPELEGRELVSEAAASWRALTEKKRQEWLAKGRSKPSSRKSREGRKKRKLTARDMYASQLMRTRGMGLVEARSAFDELTSAQQRDYQTKADRQNEKEGR